MKPDSARDPDRDSSGSHEPIWQAESPPERVWQAESPPLVSPAPSDYRVRPEAAIGIRRVGRFPLYLPMLPSSVELPPPAGAWRFEPKWDGFRALVYAEKGCTRLISRNGLDFSATFPELLDLHEQFEEDLVVDGEIIALGPGSRVDFQAVQNRLRGERSGTLSFVAFDLLQVRDTPLLDWPLEERRARLEHYTRPGNRMAWSPIFPDGTALLEHALRLGLEGIVAKRLGSLYRPGVRTKDWLKVRIRPHTEAIIAGWTEGVMGWGFGSLVLAQYADAPDGHLPYIGNVGTGFPGPVIADLMERMRQLERTEPTVAIPKGLSYWGRRRHTPVHWIEPRLVCEVEFSEWTREGILRQPSYRGLRPDKQPQECVIAPEALK